jgi:hypothetical protein
LKKPLCLSKATGEATGKATGEATGEGTGEGTGEATGVCSPDNHQKIKFRHLINISKYCSLPLQRSNTFCSVQLLRFF